VGRARAERRRVRLGFGSSIVSGAFDAGATVSELAMEISVGRGEEARCAAALMLLDETRKK
jgi:hypothetical protein